MRISRFLAALIASALALAFAACGGSDENEASTDTDVDTLLTQTFTGEKKIDSGKLDVALSIDAQGEGAAQLQGPVKVTLSGPFDARDKETLPKFALQATLEGAGQSFKAGAVFTGEKGFVAFQGTNYVLSDAVFAQLEASYEETRKKAESQQTQNLSSLGLNPRNWLIDPVNAGEAQVGDDDTIKITGGIDVAKLLDDVDKALQTTASLGVQGAGEVPEKLTAQQRQQVLDAVKDPRVEIYTGVEDKTMRRMVVTLGLEDAATSTSGTITLDISITDLNEEQDIGELEDAQPFDQLLGQLGSLGLGAAAGAGGGTSADPGAGASPDTADLEKYSQCLTDAGDDVDKARACADLLTG